ncbi:MAG: hypothetical protein ACJA1Z_000600 [Patiriisocius sp.]|jgi:hypothetical protein
MPITAFSKKFKRELDVTQLENLFKQSGTEVSFQSFVKADIECPACNVTGGYIVNEGISNTTGRIVSQQHFAFRDNSGSDAHHSFCEFYNGSDKLKVVSNEGKIDFRKSNSPVTKTIRLLVCIAIENDLVTQLDIRNMRQWFLDLRMSNNFSFNISHHLIQIARSSYTRSKRNYESFVPDPSVAFEKWFDIDKEVYESLFHRFSNYKIHSYCKENSSYMDIRLKSVVKKAIEIVKKDSNNSSFDRELLSSKYIQALRLSMEIINREDTLSRNLSASKVRSSNPMLAFSALLLFVSDWDYEIAKQKVDDIFEISTAKDLNAGNVIGLNPFINYSSWIIIKKLNDMKNEMNDKTNYDVEFNLEKNRLMKLYNLIE